LTEYLHSDAHLSADGRFRYRLERRWDRPGRVLVCVGLNPSTADAAEDDATIRVLVGLARREGYASLLMLNLYAYRATDPDQLRRELDLGLEYASAGFPGTHDVQGDNDGWLRQHATVYGRALCVWGAGAPYARQREVAALFPRLQCLGVNRDGSPWHPLRKALTGLWPWAPSLLPL
jgi:hypothetical protein